MAVESYGEWVGQWLERRGTAAGKTLSITSLLLVVYQALLIGVANTDTGTVAAFVQQVLTDSGAAFWASSPFVHQAADLLVGNLIAWVPLGYLFARHTNRLFFFGYVFSVAYVTNLVAPLIPRLFGFPTAGTVGFSGVVYALAIQETLYIFAVACEASKFSLRVVVSISTCLLFLLLYLVSMVNPEAGTSVPAHAAGLAIGFVVGVYFLTNRELARRDNWVANSQRN